MSLRFHEIAECRHRILNPFTEAQLLLLGELCQVREGKRQLDLCCGKGEMLCRWAAQAGLSGLGVDVGQVFLEAALARARDLRVENLVTFLKADASTFPIQPNSFDIVSCIGATWIGGGLAGTLKMLKPGLRDCNSLLLVGEPYWIEEPPEAAYASVVEGDREVFTTLPRTVDRMEAAGLELVEMVQADHFGWDRYIATQWLAVSDWLRTHADDPEAEAFRAMNTKSKRSYLDYGRRYFGWGVFVLRQQLADC